MQEPLLAKNNPEAGSQPVHIVVVHWKQDGSNLVLHFAQAFPDNRYPILQEVQFVDIIEH